MTWRRKRRLLEPLELEYADPDTDTYLQVYDLRGVCVHRSNATYVCDASDRRSSEIREGRVSSSVSSLTQRKRMHTRSTSHPGRRCRAHDRTSLQAIVPPPQQSF